MKEQSSNQRLVINQIRHFPHEIKFRQLKKCCCLVRDDQSTYVFSKNCTCTQCVEQRQKWLKQLPCCQRYCQTSCIFWGCFAKYCCVVQTCCPLLFMPICEQEIYEHQMWGLTTYGWEFVPGETLKKYKTQEYYRKFFIIHDN